MEKVSILIVEDDPLFSVELRRLIEEALGYEVAACVNNAADALQWMSNSKRLPDLALIDISLPGSMDGIDLAEKMTGIPIIFITSADVPGIYHRARMLMPHGYLVKPVGKLTLQSIIESALLRAGNPGLSADVLRVWQEDLVLDNHVFLKTHSGKLEKINLEEVAVIEADGNYCIIYTTQNRKHAVKISLKRMAMQLSGKLFIQIHRNYLVSLKALESVDTATNQVVVIGQELPIGASFRANLVSHLRKL
ncbi:MAG: response regulator transcription factor [Saprospiraceae bacterium]|nr:response regulator transcription factor [Saprospiraceae bacterium]